MLDPLQTVREALEAKGYEPHGPLHSFRARCPSHDGENPDALHVSVGADGRAVMHCFAYGCRVEDVVSALGLGVQDLFPPGHRHAPPRPLREARRADFQGRARLVANVLAALEAVGGEWFVSLRCDCAFCGAPAATLYASSWGICSLECSGDAQAEALGHVPFRCTLDEFQQALAARVEDRSAA